MRVEVDVTQDDIDQGTKYSETCCPIAIALSRALDSAGVSVYVGVSPTKWFTQRIHRPTGELVYVAIGNLPLAASRFVADFDFGFTPVRPFKFTIESFTHSSPVPECDDVGHGS